MGAVAPDLHEKRGFVRIPAFCGCKPFANFLSGPR